MAEQEYSHSIVWMPEDRFFWITFGGELTLGKLTRAHQEFTSHPDYFAGVDELLDFSQTSIRDLDSEGVRRISDYVIGGSVANPSRNVLVVNSDLEYGLGRMIAGNLGKTVPDERQVSFSIRDALEWLRPGHADRLIEEHRRRTAAD